MFLSPVACCFCPDVSYGVAKNFSKLQSAHTVIIMAQERVVNVASVKHYSPFRYPGGKTWFVPHFRVWLSALPVRPKTLVEPFAGGAIVGLTAVIEGWVDRLVLVEKDPSVASVWRTIFSPKCDWLIKQIETFSVTRDHVVRELAAIPRSSHRRAFQTVLRNRVQRGGIMAPGASLMLSGENGKGIASRWYPQTLATRLNLLKSIREKVTFVEGDAASVVLKFLDDPTIAFFVDPPYTAGGKRAGSRLYKHNALDHDDLFRRLAASQGSVLMTYDDSSKVRELSRRWGFEVASVPMKNTHHEVMYELMITKTRPGISRREALADKLREPRDALLFA